MTKAAINRSPRRMQAKMQGSRKGAPGLPQCLAGRGTVSGSQASQASQASAGRARAVFTKQKIQIAKLAQLGTLLFRLSLARVTIIPAGRARISWDSFLRSLISVACFAVRQGCLPQLHSGIFDCSTCTFSLWFAIQDDPNLLQVNSLLPRSSSLLKTFTPPTS
jgi:hypothetical protein